MCDIHVRIFFPFSFYDYILFLLSSSLSYSLLDICCCYLYYYYYYYYYYYLAPRSVPLVIRPHVFLPLCHLLLLVLFIWLHFLGATLLPSLLSPVSYYLCRVMPCYESRKKTRRAGRQGKGRELNERIRKEKLNGYLWEGRGGRRRRRKEMMKREGGRKGGRMKELQEKDNEW